MSHEPPALGNYVFRCLDFICVLLFYGFFVFTVVVVVVFRYNMLRIQSGSWHEFLLVSFSILQVMYFGIICGHTNVWIYIESIWIIYLLKFDLTEVCKHE